MTHANASTPKRQPIVEGDIARLPLTKGREVVVDARHAAFLAQWNWSFDGVSGYARRTHLYRIDGKRHGRPVYLHKAVGELEGIVAPNGFEIDHISRDRLDCRASNLRVADSSQNRFNKLAQSNNRSGFKGVSWNPLQGGWVAEIRAYGRRIHLGTFRTAEEASIAYEAAALELHGAFAPRRVG